MMRPQSSLAGWMPGCLLMDWIKPRTCPAVDGIPKETLIAEGESRRPDGRLTARELGMSIVMDDLLD
jgi:hypothetical protein